MSEELPIQQVLPQINDAMSINGAAVLIAPPGAGKTTAVATALIGEDWCTGQIILTSPRRVAARAAAERMAHMLGEKAGETIGYATRMDSKQSAKTRVLVVTESIFVNRILDDPELPGVSAVLFDEAHERHLDCDLGLALALESRAILREDLRVLVMSATIDGAKFVGLLGDGASIVESQGRSYPLEIKWFGSDPKARLEDHVTAATLKAWRDETGDILVFLPGVGEISRVQERLDARLPETPILPLHGQVEPAAQRAAIRRDEAGRRRIVLATAIAETSLTLDGVSVVIDSGLARYAEYDAAAGTSRLVTRAASQAAATQRAGRAARQGPGIAYRLWEEHGHAGRPEFAPPEIETADLAPLVLSLANWGTDDPSDLAWIETPPPSAIANARSRLQTMGALDQDGRISDLGRRMAALPLDPRDAASVLAGARHGNAENAARLVLLTQERGLGGRGEDLLQRLSSWNDDRSKRAESARSLSQRWAKSAKSLVEEPSLTGVSPAMYLALGRPEMIAKRRGPSGENWLSAGGRGYTLDPASPLARSEWIVIADAQGRAEGARITSGAELDFSEIERVFSDKLEERSLIDWNKEKKRVEPRLERRFGAIKLTSIPDKSPDPAQLVDILVQKALDMLGNTLPAGFLARARFAQTEALSEEALRQSAEIWLAPLLDGRRDLEIAPQKFAEAALASIDWNERQNFEAAAPTHYKSPAGTSHAIDYSGDDAPSVEVRAQALFGLDTHPMIGQGQSVKPLLLKLTSPAGRPIASTADLPGFWRGAWADVVKDMKGRYPKHRWPDAPWLEKPSMKTKNAFNRE